MSIMIKRPVKTALKFWKTVLVVIKMIAERSETMDVGRGLVFSLLMQEIWKKEIEEAIAKVKGDLPERRRQKHRRRKRGYWTPSGFAWFSRKQKWRYYGRWV